MAATIAARPDAAPGVAPCLSRTAVLRAAGIVLAAGAMLSIGVHAYERVLATEGRPPASIDVSRVFADAPLHVAVAGGDPLAPWPTTAREIRTSRAMWQRLDVAHWNGVGVELRGAALDAMFVAYRGVLIDPRIWDAMRAPDWDAVPQPIRMMAFRNMATYWAGYYDVGGSYGIPPRRMADTLAAIVMSESWFDHRAVQVNRDGSTDLGLAQASSFARVRMRELHARRRVDVAPADEEYFNPWVATRFVAIWMGLMLDEAGGDLDLAVRAYHRGIQAAPGRAGTRYLETVGQRRSRYIRNESAPPAWDDLWQRNRALEIATWPWTSDAPSGTP